MSVRNVPASCLRPAVPQARLKASHNQMSGPPSGFPDLGHGIGVRGQGWRQRRAQHQLLFERTEEALARCVGNLGFRDTVL